MIKKIFILFVIICQLSFQTMAFSEKDIADLELQKYGKIYKEGNYESLVITLGEASGNNWWCIMYPPLCLLEKNTSQERDVEYKSYLWEIISQLTS